MTIRELFELNDVGSSRRRDVRPRSPDPDTISLTRHEDNELQARKRLGLKKEAPLNRDTAFLKPRDIKESDSKSEKIYLKSAATIPREGWDVRDKLKERAPEMEAKLHRELNKKIEGLDESKKPDIKKKPSYDRDTIFLKQDDTKRSESKPEIEDLRTDSEILKEDWISRELLSDIPKRIDKNDLRTDSEIRRDAWIDLHTIKDSPDKQKPSALQTLDQVYDGIRDDSVEPINDSGTIDASLVESEARIKRNELSDTLNTSDTETSASNTEDELSDTLSTSETTDSRRTPSPKRKDLISRNEFNEYFKDFSKDTSTTYRAKKRREQFWKTRSELKIKGPKEQRERREKLKDKLESLRRVLNLNRSPEIEEQYTPDMEEEASLKREEIVLKQDDTKESSSESKKPDIKEDPSYERDTISLKRDDTKKSDSDPEMEDLRTDSEILRGDWLSRDLLADIPRRIDKNDMRTDSQIVRDAWIKRHTIIDTPKKPKKPETKKDPSFDRNDTKNSDSESEKSYMKSASTIPRKARIERALIKEERKNSKIVDLKREASPKRGQELVTRNELYDAINTFSRARFGSSAVGLVKETSPSRGEALVTRDELDRIINELARRNGIDSWNGALPHKKKREEARTLINNNNEGPSQGYQQSRTEDKIFQTQIHEIWEDLVKLDDKIKAAVMSQEKEQKLMARRSKQLIPSLSHFNETIERHDAAIRRLENRLGVDRRMERKQEKEEEQRDQAQEEERESEGENGVANVSIGPQLENLDLLVFDHDREQVKRIISRHQLELAYPDRVDREVVDLIHQTILNHPINLRKYADPVVTEALIEVDLRPYEALMSPEQAANLKLSVPFDHPFKLFAKSNALLQIMNGPTWETPLTGRRAFGGYLEAVFLKVQELADKRLRKKAKRLGIVQPPLFQIGGMEVEARRSARLTKKQIAEGIARRKKRLAKNTDLNDLIF